MGRVGIPTRPPMAVHLMAETALAYLTEKVHQNDADGQIDIGTFDGCEALQIRQSYGDSDYTTYIYAYEDALRELFVKDGAPASAEDGRAILAVSSLSFTRPDDGLLSFSCTNTDGTTARAVVQVRSTKGGAAS